MADLSMKGLLETGVHFGHRTGRWHPRMKPFIFTERNGIHIIDLQQTMEHIVRCFDVVRDVVAEGGEVLFVGTKRQAQEAIQIEAERCEMPYVNRRWLGGMITNWRTMKERIGELERMEREHEAGEWEGLKKKERLMRMRKIAKLQYRLGGIRSMRDLPRIMVVVDIRREYTAVREANILDIPVIAMVDTNCDPSPVEHVLPANDDAIRAIRLIVGHLADAVVEGRQLRKDEEPEDGQRAESMVAEMVTEADEDLLGAATLAKLSSGELEFEDAIAESAADTPAVPEPMPDAAEAEAGVEKPEPSEVESDAAAQTEAAAGPQLEE
ncbi:MAG TPA: 30S ribosomal protein S2 [Anaerolineales bacterium]|jgi:small subunit ribosomal protein S2|nr:30S ribosomal protein S2 [Anaerolineales bacterium]